MALTKISMISSRLYDEAISGPAPLRPIVSHIVHQVERIVKLYIDLLEVDLQKKSRNALFLLASLGFFHLACGTIYFLLNYGGYRLLVDHFAFEWSGAVGVMCVINSLVAMTMVVILRFYLHSLNSSSFKEELDKTFEILQQEIMNEPH